MNNDFFGSYDFALPPKAKKAKISHVWKYFEKCGLKAKCTYCGNEYCHSGNTTNLIDHIRRCQSIRNNTRSNSSPSSSVSLAASLSQSSITSFFKTNPKYNKTSKKKEQIDNALALMICLDYQPFSIVEGEGFRNLMRVLDDRYELPSKTTLENNLLMSYKNIKIQIKNELETVSHIAITCDIWCSSANDSYITVSSHFVTDDFILKCYVLSTKPLLDIKSTMQSIFEEHNIENKIVCIVTDNDHNMENVCINLQKLHLPCMAHTLNLLVQDTLKLTCIQALICKCKNIVSFFEHSNTAAEILKNKQKCDEPLKLTQEVPTMWNSALSMIKGIIKIEHVINTCLLEIENAPLPLISLDDRNILKDLVRILEPFEEAMGQVSTIKNVTISLINPIICGLFLNINGIKNKMITEEGHTAANFVVAKMEENLAHYETRSICGIATLLDTRFKIDGFRHASMAEAAVKFLENVEQHSFIKQEDSSGTDESSNCSEEQNLLGFIDQKRSRTSNFDAILTTRQYMEEKNCNVNTNPLKYWKANQIRNDVLADLAKKYFCIPASSVEAQRVLSTTGLNINEQRASLKPEIVDMLVFLHNNLNQ